MQRTEQTHSYLSKKRQKEVAALRLKKYRDRSGQYVVEGLRSVMSAATAGARLKEVIVTPETKEQIKRQVWFQGLQAPVYKVTERDMARLSEVQASQGILAVVEQHHEPTQSLYKAQSLLVLDGVQDPGNVGTLLRTAAWFGVEGVIAGTGTADFYNPKVVRSAMGGLWDVRLAKADKLTSLIEALKHTGKVIYGADLQGCSLAQWQPETPSVLVMGSEAHGLQANMLAMLDEAITIPGSPSRKGAESLNVAVAGGILMQHWLGN